MRRAATTLLFLAVVCGVSGRCFAQTNPNLQTYFTKYVGLSASQIAAIRGGQAFAKNLPSRYPAEIFVFGAVYIHAVPAEYLAFSRDFARLRELPGYLAIGHISDPPKLSDFTDFVFDGDDLKTLKNCRPGKCEIQLPMSTIEELQRSVNWSAPDADTEANQILQKAALSLVNAYLKNGNRALGIYDDKSHPTNVPADFKTILSYSRALPRFLSDFYSYLLTYPNGKPANVDSSFYWDKVKFGLKPTLRIVNVLTLEQGSGEGTTYAIAEKQLYSSHYFETALDLTFCIPDTTDVKQPGFYLVMTLGSEQAGLTGFTGSIIRKVAVNRSASSLQESLTTIRNALEHR